MLPKTPVPVTPFVGQLEIPLSEIKVPIAHGSDGTEYVTTWLSPQDAWQLMNVVKPVCFPNEENSFICFSSSVDVWRPWDVSYRASQRKSSAALPGESVHFLGSAFDLDLAQCRHRLLKAIKDYLSLTPSSYVKNVVDIFQKANMSMSGNAVTDIHVRNLMKALGFTPHRDIQREPWHFQNSFYGDGLDVNLQNKRFPALLPDSIEIIQRAFKSIINSNTGQPYYTGAIDGVWGRGCKKAYSDFYDDWPAAFNRPRGVLEAARVKTGLPPGERGQRIIMSFTAKFNVVPMGV